MASKGSKRAKSDVALNVGNAVTAPRGEEENGCGTNNVDDGHASDEAAKCSRPLKVCSTFTSS